MWRKPHPGAVSRLLGGQSWTCFETNPKHWVIGAKIQMTAKTRFVQPQVAHVSMAPGPHIDIFTVDPVEKPFGRKFRLQAYLLRGLRRTQSVLRAARIMPSP